MFLTGGWVGFGFRLGWIEVGQEGVLLFASMFLYRCVCSKDIHSLSVVTLDVLTWIVPIHMHVSVHISRCYRRWCLADMTLAVPSRRTAPFGSHGFILRARNLSLPPQWLGSGSGSGRIVARRRWNRMCRQRESIWIRSGFLR